MPQLKILHVTTKIPRAATKTQRRQIIKKKKKMKVVLKKKEHFQISLIIAGIRQNIIVMKQEQFFF